jgi:hypothetical protein
MPRPTRDADQFAAKPNENWSPASYPKNESWPAKFQKATGPPAAYNPPTSWLVP